MVRREVQHRKHVLIVFHLWPIGNRKALTRKNIYNFFAHQRQRMARSHLTGRRRTRDIYLIGLFLTCLERLLKLGNLIRGQILQLV